MGMMVFTPEDSAIIHNKMTSGTFQKYHEADQDDAWSMSCIELSANMYRFLPRSIGTWDKPTKFYRHRIQTTNHTYRFNVY